MLIVSSAATSSRGVALAVPTKTWLPLRICATASSAVVTLSAIRLEARVELDRLGCLAGGIALEQVLQADGNAVEEARVRRTGGLRRDVEFLEHLRSLPSFAAPRPGWPASAESRIYT